MNLFSTLNNDQDVFFSTHLKRLISAILTFRRRFSITVKKFETSCSDLLSVIARIEIFSILRSFSRSFDT